jgi:hypothetical protein
MQVTHGFAPGQHKVRSKKALIFSKFHISPVKPSQLVLLAFTTKKSVTPKTALEVSSGLLEGMMSFDCEPP